jgi:hypothetical protein
MNVTEVGIQGASFRIVLLLLLHLMCYLFIYIIDMVYYFYNLRNMDKEMGYHNFLKNKTRKKEIIN